MALIFVPNIPTTVARTSTAYVYTEEFTADFTSAWNYLKTNPTHTLSVEFDTAIERDEWFNMAKAYGATHDDKVCIRRVKGTGSAELEHGKLTFAMETADIRDARNEAKRKAAADVAARKAAGEVITRGRKPKTA